MSINFYNFKLLRAFFGSPTHLFFLSFFFFFFLQVQIFKLILFFLSLQSQLTLPSCIIRKRKPAAALGQLLLLIFRVLLPGIQYTLVVFMLSLLEPFIFQKEKTSMPSDKQLHATVFVERIIMFLRTWVIVRKSQVQNLIFIMDTSVVKPTKLYLPIAHYHNHLLPLSNLQNLLTALSRHISDDHIHGSKAEISLAIQTAQWKTNYTLQVGFKWPICMSEGIWNI